MEVLLHGLKEPFYDRFTWPDQISTRWIENIWSNIFGGRHGRKIEEYFNIRSKAFNGIEQAGWWHWM